MTHKKTDKTLNARWYLRQENKKMTKKMGEGLKI